MRQEREQLLRQGRSVASIDAAFERYGIPVKPAPRYAPSPVSSVKPIAAMVPAIVPTVEHDPVLDLSGDTVHIIPSAARKAVAVGLIAEYRIYVLLKHYDRLMNGGGSRFVADDKLIETIAKIAGITPLRVKRIIRSEAGRIFWDLKIIPGKVRQPDTLYINLASHERVEDRLGDLAVGKRDKLGRPAPVYDARRVSKNKALFNLSDFGDLEGLTALCFAAWINDRVKGKDQPDTPQDRGAFTGRWIDLESAWGRDRRTLLRWIDIAGVRVDHNFGTISEKDFDKSIVGRVEGNLEANGISPFREGRAVRYWRANTYIAPESLTRGKRGICTKTATTQRSRVDMVDYMSIYGGDDLHIRTNHDQPDPDGRLYRNIRSAVKLAPNKSHYVLKAVLDRGAYKKQPTSVYKLHYIGGSAVAYAA